MIVPKHERPPAIEFGTNGVPTYGIYEQGCFKCVAYRVPKKGELVWLPQEAYYAGAVYRVRGNMKRLTKRYVILRRMV